MIQFLFLGVKPFFDARFAGGSLVGFTLIVEALCGVMFETLGLFTQFRNLHMLGSTDDISSRS